LIAATSGLPGIERTRGHQKVGSSEAETQE
jgi:hypothetical protein